MTILLAFALAFGRSFRVLFGISLCTVIVARFDTCSARLSLFNML